MHETRIYAVEMDGDGLKDLMFNVLNMAEALQDSAEKSRGSETRQKPDILFIGLTVSTCLEFFVKSGMYSRKEIVDITKAILSNLKQQSAEGPTRSTKQ